MVPPGRPGPPPSAMQRNMASRAEPMQPEDRWKKGSAMGPPGELAHASTPVQIATVVEALMFGRM